MSTVLMKTDTEVLDKKYVQYQIRPKLEDKFKSGAVRTIIHECLNKELAGKEYSSESIPNLTSNVVQSIKAAVKELNLKRYKIIVHAVLGENRGAGVKIGARCFWDPDTDSYAAASFQNDSLFCSAVVFGVYAY